MEPKLKHTLWAQDSSPPSDSPVLLWNSFGFESQHPDSISLPTFIEKHADEIRSRLLLFLCNTKFVSDGRTSLEDALITPEGLSTWWLSFPSLKQWGKRQSIPIACRLIAIELIVGSEGLNHLLVETEDSNLRELIQRVIQSRSTPVHRVRRWLYRKVLHPLRALGSLIRYVRETSCIPRDSNKNLSDADMKFAFFDYFGGSESDLDKMSTYKSPYWGDAPQLADDPDWYHIYPRNVDQQGVRGTLEAIYQLNSRNRTTHHLFLGRLSLRDVLSIARNYLSQRSVHRRFRSSLTDFKLKDSGLALWHVFEDEWDDSIIGSTALRHLVLLRTTDKLVQKMPHYSKIFYLMENQPWELALTFSVRRHDKGQLVGVAHSTIRFWDLRYFSDASENNFINSLSRRPFPDHIFVNGEIGRRLLLENSYPESSISVVEALRYMYLQELRMSTQSSKEHVLLLGDFLEHANSVLVSVFKESIELLEQPPPIKVRSHPICPLTEEQLGGLISSVSLDGLSDLLQRASVVVTTAASSSAAESAALGIPTIVVLDARSLNYSPFRQTDNVYVVENANQLRTLLRDLKRLEARPSDTIFCLDPNYPRWQRELSPA